MVAGLDGGVLVPRHPFLPVRRGHPEVRQFSDMPYLDAWWANLPGVDLPAYVDRIGARHALVSGGESPLVAEALAHFYQHDGRLTSSPITIVGEWASLRHRLLRVGGEQNERVLYDFEDGTLQGWRAEGEAFEESPTSPRPAWQSPIHGAVGEGLVNSYHPRLGDTAKGTLVSPTFVIDRSFLGFRLGGGARMMVELYIAGPRPLEHLTPVFHDKEVMLEMVIYVGEHLGEEAQLRLWDRDTRAWGHMLFDHVRLFERDGPE
jgi:hypothetical protein